MNPIMDNVAPSMIRAVNARKRPDDIDLGLGEPVLPLDMEPLELAMAWVREHGCPYSPNAGIMELRAAIASYYNLPRLNAPENVCVTIGSEEAIYLALKAAVDPSTDEVLIVEPAYPAYDKLCHMEGIRFRTVALSAKDGFTPHADIVLEALRPETRAILICSPCNPTARTWPEEELRKLAAGLLERPGMPVEVISDEVYRHLYYGPEQPASIAEFYPNSWVVGSLSKSHALTGMRMGWLIAPSEGMPIVNKVHHLVVTAANTFSQRIAIEIFQRPSSFHVHREWYASHRRFLMGVLDELGLTYIPPDGAFYTMVKLEGPLAHDSVAAAFALIDEAHVVTVPGRAFGESSEGWLRVTWVATEAKLAEGLRRLKFGMGRITGVNGVPSPDSFFNER